MVVYMWWYVVLVVLVVLVQYVQVRYRTCTVDMMRALSPGTVEHIYIHTYIHVPVYTNTSS